MTHSDIDPIRREITRSIAVKQMVSTDLQLLLCFFIICFVCLKCRCSLCIFAYTLTSEYFTLFLYNFDDFQELMYFCVACDFWDSGFPKPNVIMQL